MRNKKHGIIIMIFSILLLANAEIKAGLFFMLISAYLLYRWWQNPRRVLESEINKDAQTFNIQIPRSYPLHLSLIKIYSKYLRLKTQFPALKETYQEIIEAMWKQLGTLAHPKEWILAVDSIDSRWPIPIEMKTVVSSKLQQVQKETQQWEDATLQASKIR